MIEKIRRVTGWVDSLPAVAWWLNLILWYLVAMVLVYVMMPPVSLSNPWFYDSDQSVFYMIAASWLDGLLPYRDLFDHKGPLLYACYAFGLLMASGKTGLFLVLSFFLAISFYYCFRTCRLFVGRFDSLAMVLAYIVVVSTCLGGYSEDFSLPFVIIPFYYITRHLYINHRASGFPLCKWLLAGCCFGVIFLIRPNNAGVLCAAIAFLGVKLLMGKKFLELIRACIVFTVGFLIIGLVVMGYFYLKGALEDCINGAYTFNLLFSKQGVAEKGVAEWMNIAKYTASLWLIAGFGAYALKKCMLSGLMYAYMLTVAVLAAVCVVPGQGYLHYFTLYSPCVILAFICMSLSIRAAKSRKIITMSVLSSFVAYAYFIGFAVVIARYGLYAILMPENHRIHRNEMQTVRACENMKRMIPESELNQVMYYGAQGNVYLYMQAKPPSRYFMLQEFLFSKVPEVRKDVEAAFNSEHAPQWVICRDYDMAGFQNAALLRFLSEECTQVEFQKEPTSYRLYRRKQ